MALVASLAVVTALAAAENALTPGSMGLMAATKMESGAANQQWPFGMGSGVFTPPGMGGQPMPYPGQAPPVAFGAMGAAPAPQENYMWLCLENIYPQDMLQQAGVKPQVATILSSYATHAYVLHGTTPQTSVGWQMSLNEGQAYWSKVLVDVNGMDMDRPIEWLAEYSSHIIGTTKISSAPGSYVYSHSEKCFRSKTPSTCTADEVSQFSSRWAKDHAVFKLREDNCVTYACNLLASCSGAPQDKCDLSACAKTLAESPMKEKESHCEMDITKAPTPQQVNYGYPINPNMFGQSPFGFGMQNQAKPESSMQMADDSKKAAAAGSNKLDLTQAQPAAVEQVKVEPGAVAAAAAPETPQAVAAPAYQFIPTTPSVDLAAAPPTPVDLAAAPTTLDVDPKMDLLQAPASADETKQLSPADLDALREFMPMHAPGAVDNVKQMLAASAAAL